MDKPLDHYLRRSAEIVAECAELGREVARMQARQAALAHERVALLLEEVPTGSAGFDQAERSMISEVAAGLHLSRYAAAKMLATGHVLHERFPRARAALEAGDVSLAHAEVVIEAAADIPHDDTSALAEYEAQVVPFAAAESRARTKAFAESVAAAVAPIALTDAHRRAHDDRAVTVTDDGAGQATMHASGPAALIHAAYDLLTQEARTILDAAKQARRESGDEDRTGGGQRLDQVRFDRFLLKVLTGRIADDADIITGIRATSRASARRCRSRSPSPRSSVGMTAWQSWTGAAPWIRTSPAGSPSRRSAGSDSSSTRRAGSSAPARTGSRKPRGDSFAPGIAHADSPAAASPLDEVRSTTITISPEAVPPTPATSHASARPTTP
ncbi:DUF222 domain-containing protein [Microbacterium sp. MYb64]|uniref:DUF222 domain-containing protein n=1 Tax=Microbacterium sp. MYb64 TaxID=1848691 RepID=UPI000CFC2FAA|nr:DUF222 domain-containing protein [Microbacterium sp. MYb64]PRB05788.1 hypothetical protein CQ044_09155 [Microbacterium sp. MYb64]